MMVALHLGTKKHFVEFAAVPLVNCDDFRCTPEGVIQFDSAVEIARELAAGYLSGVVAGYRWYRQAGGSKMEPRGPVRSRPSPRRPSATESSQNFRQRRRA